MNANTIERKNRIVVRVLPDATGWEAVYVLTGAKGYGNSPLEAVGQCVATNSLQFALEFVGFDLKDAATRLATNNIDRNLMH